MQVILLERVAKLGQMGDVVDVKNGYARNYLLLQGKALTASKENIEAFEGQKAQLEARNLETKKEAEDLAAKLDGQQFIVIRQASDGGNLYGSVSTRDAATVATEEGFSIDRKQILIRQPIKELGLHEVKAGHLFAYRVFDLDARIDLDEVERLAVDVVEKLDGTSIAVLE